MHWSVYCREFEDKQSILSFDLNNEKFRKIALPGVSADRLREQSLAVFEENLAYFTFSYPNLILSIWVIGEYGIEESWNELFVIQTKYSIESFGCTMHGELLVGSLVKGSYVVVSLDPETCRVKNSGVFVTQYSVFITQYSVFITQLQDVLFG
ncbi:hypothetical protein SO802_009223 [Lithocarpus litseifolius]|uniref:F-box associated beta-propeller type 1 domain-containing protein n=1 Tax=Lithocarpus litseifolius TaxID=425828 RepID=A0AAW2DBF7_9ROSI